MTPDHSEDVGGAPPSDQHDATPQFESPNAGELDALAVLWAEQKRGGTPLRLNVVHRRVCDRRAAFGDPEPAVTTVSTHLRALLAKKLICAVDARAVGARRERMRGMLTPAQRSPHTAYVAARTPEEVLKGTLRGIVSAVPCEDRFRVILLIAEVTGAPRSVIAEIRATLLRCGLIDSQQRGEEQVQVTMEARGGPETELEGTGNEIA